jgi:hypothetical protein
MWREREFTSLGDHRRLNDDASLTHPSSVVSSPGLD